MRQSLLFHGLDAEVVDEVLAGARRRTFRRGDVVFHAGDPGDSVQVIARGHFALRLVTPRGDVCMTRVFGPGDMFGRLALGTIEAVREATVVSLDESETFELFRRQLDELRTAHPSVSDALIALAGLEIRNVSVRLLEALYVDADRRVRRRLLELGELFRDGSGIPLTQEDIAALAGTSRATVSRVLAEEERRGTIAKRRRSIELTDVEELSRWAAWPDASTGRS
ncbi:MAG TPA: Crp/Fnr family transcriptional regulator [Solirubrobacteraceae bacterium]|nr:Crp/Fnr family transcriptional regulator [Solirubrobacteraceae bacterium]